MTPLIHDAIPVLGDDGWRHGRNEVSSSIMPRKRTAITDLKSLARTHTAKAIQVLAGIMNSPKCQDTARAMASNSLLDRGWGRAAQAVEMTVEDRRDNMEALRQVHEILRPDQASEAIEPTKH